MTAPADLTKYGTPPKLAWIEPARLSADPRYQRSIEGKRSQANIARIVEDFSWALFGAATVAETAAEEGEPALRIIDGQHRVEAARRLGISHVPCLLVEVATLAEAARIFVRANRDRVALTPLAIHAALVEAGDAEACSIKFCCDAAGVELLRYPVQVRSMKAGQTMAIGTIRQVRNWWGEAALTEALRLVLRFWPQPGEIRAERIRAVGMMVRGEGEAAAARALQACGAAVLERVAHRAPEEGMPRYQAIYKALYRHHRAADSSSRLPAPTQEARRPAGPTGKAQEARRPARPTGKAQEPKAAAQPKPKTRAICQPARPAELPTLKGRPAKPGKNAQFVKPEGAPAVKKRRRCLHCRNDFTSAWEGHRICDDCKTLRKFKESDSNDPVSTGERVPPVGIGRR